MGSFLSSHHGKRSGNAIPEEHSHYGARKRPRISAEYDDGEEENPRLIPNLPDEISLQILARLPRMCYLSAKSVSRRWKAAVASAELYRLREELRTTEEWLYVLQKGADDRLLWHAFDPDSGRWQRLPLMPDSATDDEEGLGVRGGASASGMWTLIGSTTIKFADIIKSWIQRGNAAGGRSCLCGCAIGSADGCVYVLGGFSGPSATRGVWRYDPRLNSWRGASPMSAGRAYCKTASLNGKLYAVGGVSRDGGGLVPLHSAEAYDPGTGSWSPVPSMTFAKARVLPAALFADIIKPIATGMTSYMGRLCVPQSLYTWPFFVDVGGEVYDPAAGSWAEMPAGMGEGWPARQAGTKLSVVVNGDLYALDPSSSSSYGGKIKVYDPQEDAWKVAISKVPIRDFADSESPYLLAGIRGKLHVVTKDAGGNTVIFRADLPGNACSSSHRPLPPAGEGPASSSAGEKEIWKMVAAKNFGAAELLSCQVLDI